MKKIIIMSILASMLLTGGVFAKKNRKQDDQQNKQIMQKEEPKTKVTNFKNNTKYILDFKLDRFGRNWCYLGLKPGETYVYKSIKNVYRIIVRAYDPNNYDASKQGLVKKYFAMLRFGGGVFNSVKSADLVGRDEDGRVLKFINSRPGETVDATIFEDQNGLLRLRVTAQ